ncbi:hypothetical protein NLI96_g8058 [Meripilus lineatus]|uniref:Mur ligase central domain-containing protein n=1 Tax=Meripilus lineatus TaxID=2056292 RepID=A0AAD5YGK2_9APHY|nr:hypothetical protein NLI96_g8058 [Physisporinus lineatus]
MSIDLSLDRIRILLRHLPPFTRPTCHIAGTNGKGSVSALLTSILQASSPPYRVGRYNSPHLISIHDCITIDNEPISNATYIDARNRVEATNTQHKIGASNFELLTSVAFLIFEEAKVDIAIIEVGMGGRLDATNVIADECILASALTAVDLDHQAFLGGTVSDITREKVAIARKGKPFILGPQKYPEVVTVAQEITTNLNADLIHSTVPAARRFRDPDTDRNDGKLQSTLSLLPSSFTQPPSQPLEVTVPCFPEPLQMRLPLQGEHQIANLGTALSIISALLTHSSCAQWDPILHMHERISVSSVCRGIENTTWPGRLSFHKFPILIPSQSPPSSPHKQELIVLVDGAHNPASSSTLSKYISNLFGSIFGASKRSISQDPAPISRTRRITLTYILSLSHSPPKTPLQTLSPLLPPKDIAVPNGAILNINVALVPFTPPDGMPWVKSVPPADLKKVITTLIPNARIYCPSDDGPADGSSQLENALKWAGESQISGDGQIGEGLIVIAGSLYLVADFYRLLARRVM